MPQRTSPVRSAVRSPVRAPWRLALVGSLVAIAGCAAPSGDAADIEIDDRVAPSVDATSQCLYDAKVFGADPNLCITAFWNAATDNAKGDYPVWAEFVRHGVKPDAPPTLTSSPLAMSKILRDKNFLDFLGKVLKGDGDATLTQVKANDLVKFDDDDLKKTFPLGALVIVDATLKPEDAFKGPDEKRTFDPLNVEIQGDFPPALGELDTDPVKDDLDPIDNDGTKKRVIEAVKNYYVDLKWTGMATLNGK